MKIAHAALWTADLDGAAAFWQRYFDATVGAPYRSQRRAGFVSRFVSLPGQPKCIELMTGPWVRQPPQADLVGWDHLAVCLGEVAAVDALAARAQADGCLAAPPRWTGDGFYEAVLHMPDGTRIEITA